MGKLVVGRVQGVWLPFWVFGSLASVLVAACGEVKGSGAKPGPGQAGEGGAAAEAGGSASAGEAPSQGGETSGGANTSYGGAPGGDAGSGGAPNVGEGGEAGEGGAPTVPTRAILAHILSVFDGTPVAGIVVAINGVDFKSDAKGLVRAQAAPGPYQAIVFDTPNTGYHPVEVWEGLDDDAPTFEVVDGDDGPGPHPLPVYTAYGSMSGPYPIAAQRSAGFWNARYRSGYDSVLGDSDDFSIRMQRNRAQDVGFLAGLARSGTGFWFAQEPFLPTATVPHDLTLALAAVDTHSFEVTFAPRSEVTSTLSLDVGPFRLANADIGASTQQTVDVPTGPAVLAAKLPMTVGLSCQAVYPAVGSSATFVDITPELQTVNVSCPDVVKLEPPAVGSGFTRTTPFTFKTQGPTCSSLNVQSGVFDVTVHTTQGQVTLPDLEPWGISWPGAGQASTELNSYGPCTNVGTAEPPVHIGHWSTYTSATVELE